MQSFLHNVLEAKYITVLSQLNCDGEEKKEMM